MLYEGRLLGKQIGPPALPLKRDETGEGPGEGSSGAGVEGASQSMSWVKAGEGSSGAGVEGASQSMSSVKAGEGSSEAGVEGEGQSIDHSAGVSSPVMEVTIDSHLINDQCPKLDTQTNVRF